MTTPSNFGFCLSSLGLAATCYFRESQTARALDPLLRRLLMSKDILKSIHKNDFLASKLEQHP